MPDAPMRSPQRAYSVFRKAANSPDRMGMAERLQESPVVPRPEVPPVCLVYRRAQEGQPRMTALIAAMKRVMEQEAAVGPPTAD